MTQMCWGPTSYRAAHRTCSTSNSTRRVGDGLLRGDDAQLALAGLEGRASTAYTEEAVRPGPRLGSPSVQMGGEQRCGQVARAVGLHREPGRAHGPGAVAGDREHLDGVVGPVGPQHDVTSTVAGPSAGAASAEASVDSSGGRLGVGEEAELELVGRDHVGDAARPARARIGGIAGSTKQPLVALPITGSQVYVAAGLAAFTRATASTTTSPMPGAAEIARQHGVAGREHAALLDAGDHRPHVVGRRAAARATRRTPCGWRRRP